MRPLTALTLNRYHLFRNTLRQGTMAWIKLIGSLIFLIAFMAAVFYGALVFLNYLAKLLAGAPPGLLPQVQVTLLNGMALSLAMVLIISGMNFAYERLFESADTAFLLTAPIPLRTVFVHKAIDVFNRAMATAAPFGLPVFWAFGVSVQAPLFFYLYSTIAVLLGIILFQSIVNLLLMLIMRYVPGRLMKQIFMGIAATGGISIVVISQIIGSRAMQEKFADPLVLMQTVSQWGLERLWYLPHVWVTRLALSPLPQFNFPGAINFAVLLGSAFGLVILTILAAEHIYLAGWGAGQDSGAVRKRAKRAETRSKRRLLPRGPVTAIAIKDLMGYRREPLFWYTTTVSAVVLTYFAFNIMGTTDNSDRMGITQGMVLIMPVMMAGITIAQLGGLGISREGSNWWFMQSSPVTPQRLYISKLLAAFLPGWLLATAFILIYHLVMGLQTYPLVVALPLETLMVAAVASLAMIMDIYSPNFGLVYELGNKSQSSGKVTFTLLSSMAFIVLIALTLTFAGFYDKITWFAAWSPSVVRAFSISAAFAETISVVLTGFHLGQKRLGRLLCNIS